MAKLKNIKLQHIFVYPIVAACTIFLFVGVKLTQNQELKELWNLGHFVLFLFIAYPAIIRRKLEHYTLLLRIGITATLTLLIASSIEFIQLFLNRNVSIIDVYISICGGITSVFLFTQLSKTQRILGSALFTGAGSIIFLYTVVLFIHSKIHYPIVIGISKQHETSYVLGRAKRRYDKETGEIKVVFKTDVYSSIKFTNILNDWSQFTQLKVTLSNLEERAFRLKFDIFDKAHVNSGLNDQDRYNNRIHIDPGKQDIIIKMDDIKQAPLNREMDMRNIQQLQLFTKYADRSFRVIIHSITLE